MRFGFFDQLHFLREAGERLRPLGGADIKSFEAWAVFGEPEYAMFRESMTLFATEVLPHCR